MPRHLRTLVLAIALSLMASASAQAVIENDPGFTLSPFTKAQAGSGNAVGLTMLWAPSKFLSNGADDHQELISPSCRTAARRSTPRPRRPPPSGPSSSATGCR